MTQVGDLVRAWTQLIDDLPASQRAWLITSQPVTVHESTAIVAVPDEFTRSQIETRLRPSLEDGLSSLLGQRLRLAVTVDPALLGPAADVASRDAESDEKTVEKYLESSQPLKMRAPETSAHTVTANDRTGHAESKEVER